MAIGEQLTALPSGQVNSTMRSVEREMQGLYWRAR